MPTTTRQTNLLVSEDWRKIYQTFKEADFQSYDFETLRKSMIDYLRLNYPEDFNDFIESSEYVALIDLIAFLGQALAYRTDLNARESFLDTAERRDSILKLARLVNYSPKRSIPASGLLKIDSVSTTERIVDSNGIDISDVPIVWDDVTNDNWVEQFNLVLNATLIDSQVIGKPGNSQKISGVKTDEYAINLIPTTSPVFRFERDINGTPTTFEAVSATSINKGYLYENEPGISGTFNFLYRNDNKGNSSNNTGYFLYFKQGQLVTETLTFDEAIPNRVQDIEYSNINNSDVWLYSVNSNNEVDTLWTAVPTMLGQNVIYNKQTARTLYQVNTLESDQIQFIFGDSAFAEIPQGTYQAFFRVSNGLTYKITPAEMQGVTISVNYISRTNRVETLTFRASLQYTVSNATARETLDDIRQRAPQQYYTQGRMITGEDYNILPFTSFSDVIKVKAINRTSSGVSRYLDVIDTSGKYSSTNIFGQDGILYTEENELVSSFSFTNTAEVSNLVQLNILQPLKEQGVVQFYYENYPKQIVPTGADQWFWEPISISTNGGTGYLLNSTNPPERQTVGPSTTSQLRFVQTGSIIRFRTPAGYHFNKDNEIVPDSNVANGDKDYVYVTVRVTGNGTDTSGELELQGIGAIQVNEKLTSLTLSNGDVIRPSIDYIVTPYVNTVSTDIEQSINQLILTQNSFGLYFDYTIGIWRIINGVDLDLDSKFNRATAGNTVGGQDSSWILSVVYSDSKFTVRARNLVYVFSSEKETSFYFDPNVKVYDSRSGQTVKDQISILGINSKPSDDSPLGTNYTWQITSNILSPDGFDDKSRVQVSFMDKDDDGSPDNPDLFGTIVDSNSLVFFNTVSTVENFIELTPLAESVNTSYATLIDLSQSGQAFVDQQLFYTRGDGKFYRVEVDGSFQSFVEQSGYVARRGRKNLYFQYRHNSPDYRRIDPTPNNIIDLYLLTRSYETDYRRWVQDTSGVISEPTKLTTDELKLNYGSLENIKAVSDTIVFNSARFKPLFGAKADPSLRAKFKVIKNSVMSISENEIKSQVVSAINTFFQIENWDFGESFYFSELSAYLHNALTPNVSSVVIVPYDSTKSFGTMFQVNAEFDEILISAATVDDIEVISALTAAQLNSR